MMHTRRYPTLDERLAGVTKLRYMQFREQASSSASLGFRIEALRVNGASDKVGTSTNH